MLYLLIENCYDRTSDDNIYVFNEYEIKGVHNNVGTSIWSLVFSYSIIERRLLFI